METETLDNIEKECCSNINSFVVDSLGPVEFIESMEDGENNELIQGQQKLKIQGSIRRIKLKHQKKKLDPEMELEEKKQRRRKEKIDLQLASGLENFSLDTDKNMSIENYDFSTDCTTIK
ncbi:hypothetical protein NQ317_002236 [Molorchus minor]|uniref:Uncharacterized protein n=1 Tax=Molorchus minor TaxID=1323400 RepID=A0ABQ9JER5_9CUCU|nr:hypothetical protein NQ317_002236 [Molorchus minor]